MPSFNSLNARLYGDPIAGLNVKSPISSSPQNIKTPSEKKPNTAPQVYATDDAKNPISLLLPAPSIKNIAFPGGGASAVVTTFALEQMNLDQVEHFAGCSGGGLVGALLASGVEPAELGKILEKKPLAAYLGTVPDFEVLYPDATSLPAKSDLNFFRLAMHIGRMALMTLFLGNWQRSAQGAIQFMDKVSSEAVSQRLQDAVIWDKCIAAHKAGNINDTQMKRLTFLKDSVWFSEPSGANICRIENMITFGDLELLHSIEPTKFKKLTLVSSKITAQTDDKAPTTTNVTKTIFNALNTPDTPIAMAGRASMSIPFYFQTFWYQGKSYSDGAMTDRIPADILWGTDNTKDAVSIAKAHAETMVLDFKNHSLGDTFTPTLYGKPPTSPDKNLSSKAIEWFLGYPGYSKAVGQDNQTLYEGGPNTFIIDNDRIGPFDMAPNKKKFDAAAEAAAKLMKQQLEMRENEAYYLPFDNVVSAWNSLDETQKAQVREAGNPELDPDFKKLLPSTQYVQSAFYVLAASSAKAGTLESKETKTALAPEFNPDLSSTLAVKARSAAILASLASSLALFTTMNLSFTRSFSISSPTVNKA